MLLTVATFFEQGFNHDGILYKIHLPLLPILFYRNKSIVLKKNQKWCVARPLAANSKING
jgi:hypothetical protein